MRQLVTTIAYTMPPTQARFIVNIGWTPAARIAWVSAAESIDGDSDGGDLARCCDMVSDILARFGDVGTTLEPVDGDGPLEDLINTLVRIERGHGEAVRYALECAGIP